MHIYNSNHYSSTIKQIINDCLHSAKENPFAIHYIIVDDPKYYEEIFLKCTDTLFNIELMTLSSFYQKLLQIYHQDFRKKTDIQNLLEIIKMNKEDTSSLFHLSANHVLTAKQILDIFKSFYLYNIQETTKELPDLSKEKIKTLFNLYHQFDQTHFLEHDLIYSLIDEKCHNYYYFLTNQITIPKNQALIQKLDQYGHVFIYQDTKENEILDYTGYVTNHLFDSSHTKSDFEHPYQILKASTIQEEVKQVVFDINTLLKENALRDFVIYYPNDDYYRHLCRILDQFNLAYNRKETITNQAFQVVNMLLQYCLSKDETYLLDAISSLYLLNFQDHQYVSYLKNLYTLQGFIDDENYLALKKAVLKIQGHDLSSYSLSLIDFIEHSFCKNELKQPWIKCTRVILKGRSPRVCTKETNADWPISMTSTQSVKTPNGTLWPRDMPTRTNSGKYNWEQLHGAKVNSNVSPVTTSFIAWQTSFSSGPSVTLASTRMISPQRT